MTRHEMRECIFCLMFQNDFYGTDEFEEQMSNFLANFHFPEEHEISEKDEKEVREKVERLIALMPDIDEKISANAKGWKIERIAKAELAILRLAVYEALYDVVIGNQKSGRSLIVIGAIHAREYMTTQLCMAQIELYLQNYNDKIGVTSTNEVLNRIAVHYIPMANPDGVSISQSGLSAIQNASLKNALKKMPGADKTKYWKANARGVDLNKNFNYNYIAKYGGKRGSEGYTGESVNSEPETKAIVAFLDKMKSSGTLKGLINYHATGSILFGDAKGSVKPVVTKMYELAKKITGYADSSGYEESVNEHSKKKNIGNLREYAMYKKNIPCITLEIGKNACPLSAGEFYSIWKKNKVLVLKEAKLFTK